MTDNKLTPELVFNDESYTAFDKVRFEHFDTLNIDIKGKTVLELGSGIGNHTKFLYRKSPKKIITIEGRAENVDVLKKNFKSAKKVVPILHDLEKPLDDVDELKDGVDLIYNYGLLYHLKNPFQFIDDLQSIKHDKMILETCIELDGNENNLLEDTNSFSQSLSGTGSRPNLYRLVEKLQENYKNVFYPTPPKHGWFDIHANPSPVLKRIVIICEDQILDKPIKVKSTPIVVHELIKTEHGNKDILERFKEILEPLQQPVVIEFGACDAYHSRIMLDILQESKKLYTYHLFEPNPDLMGAVVDKIRYYLTSNSTHVRFFAEAIGASNGKMTFYKSGGQKYEAGVCTANYYGSSSIRKPKLVTEAFKEMTFVESIVDVVSLDYHVKRAGLEGKIIDFIWADIQGAEVDLINGGQEAFKNVRYLYTEYVDSELYEGEIGLLQILKMLPDFEVIEDYNGDVLLKNKNL